VKKSITTAARIPLKKNRLVGGGERGWEGLSWLLVVVGEGLRYLPIDSVRVEIACVGGRSTERRKRKERARPLDLQVDERLRIPIPSDPP